jgi:hypothetical protein
MRDFRDAKAMAHALREALTVNGMQTSHSEAWSLNFGSALATRIDAT